ncbi:hypothetical protein [Streptomyces puniciscabiei]|uniref:hypothetical protein n=1 Tax=Streptomyces puniciscabiei TaxID=164348 RepID=UPI0037B73831
MRRTARALSVAFVAGAVLALAGPAASAADPPSPAGTVAPGRVPGPCLASQQCGESHNTPAPCRPGEPCQDSGGCRSPEPCTGWGGASCRPGEACTGGASCRPGEACTGGASCKPGEACTGGASCRPGEACSGGTDCKPWAACQGRTSCREAGQCRGDGRDCSGAGACTGDGHRCTRARGEPCRAGHDCGDRDGRRGPGTDGCDPPTVQHGVEAGAGGSFSDSVPALAAGAAFIAAACGGAGYRLYGRCRPAGGRSTDL